MSIYTDLDFLGKRNEIESALAGLLGTYTFPANNNQTVPAIAIDINNQYPVPGVTVEGLEVVIRPLSDASVSKTIGKGRDWTVETQIVFKQWDDKSTVLDAVEAVVNYVDLGVSFDIGARIVPSEKIGNIESQTITYVERIGYRVVG